MKLNNSLFLLLFIPAQVFGLVAQFDGTAAHIQVDDNDNFNLDFDGSDFSIIAFIYWNGTGNAGDYLTIADKRGSTGSNGWEYSFKVDTNSTDGKMTLVVNNNDNDATASSLDANTWYCVAAVFDDTANTIVHYKTEEGQPGELINTVTGVSGSINAETASSMVIGECDHQYVSESCYWPGYISGPYIKGEVLTENEILNACSNIRKVNVAWDYAPNLGILDYDAAFPTTPIVDNFNRSDGTIGSVDGATSPWTHSTSESSVWNRVVIDTNEIKSENAGGGGETYNPWGQLPHSVELYWEYDTLPDTGRNVLHYLMTDEDNLLRTGGAGGGDGTGYLFEYSYQTGTNDDIWYYYDQAGENTSATEINSVTSFDMTAGNVIGIRKVGNCVWYYDAGTERMNDCTDGTYRFPMWAGIFTTDNAPPRYDDFGGGAIAFASIYDYSGNGNHTLNITGTITSVREQPQGMRLSF